MDEYKIQEILLKHLHSHKYKLTNSYIYDWESDFFSQTCSGYYQEIEIKTTRADFKNDFNKINKHKSLELRHKKIKGFVKRGRTYYYVTKPKMIPILQKNGFGYKVDENGKILKVPSGKYRTYLESNMNGVHPRDQKFKIELIKTSIYFSSVIVPNKFYYCVPEGLINKSEVPLYAGLLYIINGEVKTIKQAPFIHKDIIDLDRIIKDKFYYKYVDIKWKYDIMMRDKNKNVV